MKFPILIVRESYNEKTIYPHLIASRVGGGGEPRSDKKSQTPARPKSGGRPYVHGY